VRGATRSSGRAGPRHTLLRLEAVGTFGRLCLESASPAPDRRSLSSSSTQEEAEAGLTRGLPRGRPAARGASTETDFGHRCDTLGGSSGSPVLDRTTGGRGAPPPAARARRAVNQAVEIGAASNLRTQVDAAVFDRVGSAAAMKGRGQRRLAWAACGLASGAAAGWETPDVTAFAVFALSRGKGVPAGSARRAPEGRRDRGRGQATRGAGRDRRTGSASRRRACASSTAGGRPPLDGGRS
jgi:hypothetical protein